MCAVFLLLVVFCVLFSCIRKVPLPRIPHSANQHTTHTVRYTKRARARVCAFGSHTRHHFLSTRSLSHSHHQPPHRSHTSWSARSPAQRVCCCCWLNPACVCVRLARECVRGLYGVRVDCTTGTARALRREPTKTFQCDRAHIFIGVSRAILARKAPNDNFRHRAPPTGRCPSQRAAISRRSPATVGRWAPGPPSYARSKWHRNGAIRPQREYGGRGPTNTRMRVRTANIHGRECARYATVVLLYVRDVVLVARDVWTWMCVCTVYRHRFFFSIYTHV